MWGAHFYSFFSPAWLYGAMVLVVAAIAAILITKKIPAHVLAEAGSWRLVGVAVAAGGFLFWTFRICHTYLGDGSVLVQEIDSYRHLLPREPLTSLLQRGVYAATQAWFVTPGRPQESVAEESIGRGARLPRINRLFVAQAMSSNRSSRPSPVAAQSCGRLRSAISRCATTFKRETTAGR